MKSIAGVVFSLLLLLGLQADFSFNTAQARPGGGHSSSSHSSSRGSYRSSPRSSSRSSGSRSTGGGYSYGPSWGNTTTYRSNGQISMSEAEFFFMLLVFAIFIIVLVNMRRGRQDSIYSAPTSMVKNWQSEQLANEFERFKQLDPNFSKILLLDFVHSLYCKFYSYTGQTEFSYLNPFLSSELQSYGQASLLAATIDEVVINGIHWQEINLNNPRQDSIVLVIDANYTQHLQGKKYPIYRDRTLATVSPERLAFLKNPKKCSP